METVEKRIMAAAKVATTAPALLVTSRGSRCSLGPRSRSFGEAQRASTAKGMSEFTSVASPPKSEVSSDTNQKKTQPTARVHAGQLQRRLIDIHSPTAHPRSHMITTRLKPPPIDAASEPTRRTNQANQ